MEIAGIGYQGRSVDDLIRVLSEAHIAAVIDVREVPWSRKPGFSKSPLAASLARAGIHYVHLRAAGNPRENRKTAGSTQESLARYRQHLGNDPAVLDEIVEAARKQRIALLCFEAASEECHRSILIEQIAARHGPVDVIAL
jgi:uncharacterized protein (DUF488 family)